MKRFTKFAAALLVLCMIASLVPAAFAAEYAGEPGKTVNVVFEIKNITGIDGEITLDDPNGIVASCKIAKVETSLVGVPNNNKVYYSVGNDLLPVSFKLTYEVKLKTSVMEDETCNVTFKYRSSDENFDLSDWKELTHTVVVEEPEPPETTPTQPAPTQPAPTEPKPTEPKPTEPKPTEPAPTEPKPTEPKPTEPAVKVDTTKLQEQINIAQGLKAEEYTAESWAALQTALAEAKKALNSGNQSRIDAAKEALETAIGGLVKIDYSALEKAIADVEKFLGENAVGGKTQELLEALQAGKALLTSKDQKAVDDGAALLVKVLAELQKIIEDLVVVEKVEVEKVVEVEPSDPYCNISMHYVWPILFFISLFVNVAFVVLVVIYFVRRKKNQTDDTPLVDYDIGDDAVDTAE